MSERNNSIWIDLDNSPHVPFFKPIIDELEQLGYSVMVTARDCFQVCGLADRLGLTYKSIGQHSGKNKIKKAFGLFYRAMQMGPKVLRSKPDLAVSHGSRSQAILSSLLRIPSVYLCDYEFARPLPFMHPDWILTPDVISDSALPNKNNHIRFLKYPGIKEDVYVPSFKPQPGILRQLGFDENDVIVTVRPPATEAHYFTHHSEEMFRAAIDWLGGIDGLRMIILPRNETQARTIGNMWPSLFASDKAVIPACVVDGLNLIWHSDFVISGGGTMNREAAALGVPVYSIFRGSIGAVDNYLAENARLVLLERPEDFDTKVRLEKWARPAVPEKNKRDALETIIRHLVGIMEGQLPRTA